MMKKLNFMLVMLMIVVIVFTACSNQSNKVNSDVDNSVSFLADKSKTKISNSKIVTENESSTEVSITETTTAQSTTKLKETEKSTTAKTTSAKPDDKKSAGQDTTKKQTQTTTEKQTATQKKSTKSKETTTKKVTTTEATTEKPFDINYWVRYAKNYAKSVGLNLDSGATACWDNPINANSKCIYLERDIQSRLNRYAKDDDITDVWIWTEETGSNSYKIYIGYA